MNTNAELVNLPKVLDNKLNPDLSDIIEASIELKHDLIRHFNVEQPILERLTPDYKLIKIKIITGKEQQEQQYDGWRFYPIKIHAPQQTQDIVIETLHKFAQMGTGLFSNSTDVANLPDVTLDEFLGVEVYNVVSSFLPYYSDLSKYGVIEQTLDKDHVNILFKVLKDIADYIKANTDKPLAVRYTLYNFIKRFDEFYFAGVIFQILILQGLLSMLEKCTLKEGKNGYNEVQDLCNWIAELLKDKLRYFTIAGALFGDEDKKRLQPLCDYLYNTKIGRSVQQMIFESDTPDLNEPTDNRNNISPEVVKLPDILDTPEALEIFEQARELGLIDRKFKWLKSLRLLACFAREMSLKMNLGKGHNGDGTQRISWQPFEGLFNIPKGKLRANYNDVQKTGQQPTDHELIDEIFN